MSLAIYYGSTTGNTESAAGQINEALGSLVTHFGDICDAEPTDLMQHDVLVLGCPTWNVGELQDDWDDFLTRLDGVDLSGKKIALFGLGDSFGYSQNFLDALGLMWEELKELGSPQLIGVWPSAGYEFDESKGMYDEDHFLGLGLDEENEPDLHEERIRDWTNQLRRELGA